MKTCLNLALASSLLFAVACGKDSSSSSKKKAIQPVTKQLMDWRISMVGKNYPAKASVDINGTTVANECLDKSPVKVDRSVEPQVLTVKFDAPTAGKVQIVVSDCDANVEVVNDKNVQFSIVKTGETKTVVVNL